jgi:hypothetical protein
VDHTVVNRLAPESGEFPPEEVILENSETQKELGWIDETLTALTS